jgi:protein-disulfide isomerase
MTKKKQVVEEEEIEQVEVEKPALPVVTINIQTWTTPIVGLVMLVIGLLVGFYVRPLTLAQANTTTTNAPIVVVTQPAVIPTADQSAAQQSLMYSLIPKMRHFKGDPKAPVTIIEFADFQCPFCGRFFATTQPQIDEAYIQSGKVRLGYWNFAFLGDESTWAAESAECAADQDKFWEYHDKLYASQSGENQGAFNKDNLKKFAEELGLDTQTFNECLDSGKYTSLIQDDTSTSSALGVKSTPTFLVNGQAIVGAQPFEAFQQIIDPLLK